MLLSALCRHQGGPGTLSPASVLTASDRWGGAAMGEAAGGPAIVLALFLESEFILIPTGLGGGDY